MMQRLFPGGKHRPNRNSSFWMLALATAIMMAAASAPSPIYPLYRDRWHFSVTMLTVIFAVYVVGLLGALLTVGSLSDHLGRRPVLIAGFLAAAVSSGTFWVATGPSMLVVARFVQGVGSGTTMSALAAALVDHAPVSRAHLATTVTAVGTSLGMAGGGALVGLLMEWTKRPDLIVFPLLAAVFTVLAVMARALPGQRPVRVSSLSLRPRVRVDASARSEFWTAAPTTIAGWAATGLFLALMPSLVRDKFQLQFASAGGLAIAVLYIAVTIGSLWSVRLLARTATIYGAAAMAIGALVMAAALASASAAAFGAGALALGLGVGLTFNANLRAVNAASSPEHRSETFAAVYLLSYVSLSVPTLIAGLVAPALGMEATTYGFLAFLLLLSASSIFVGAVGGRAGGAREEGMLTGRESRRPRLTTRRPATAENRGTCAGLIVDGDRVGASPRANQGLRKGRQRPRACHQ